MEGQVLEHRAQALHGRVAELEALATAVRAAADQPDEGGAASWRPGGRDFQQVFMAETLSGFYVDKTRVLQREALLMARLRESKDHQLIDRLAGRSREHTRAGRKAAEDRVWRRLDQFNEVPSD